MNDTAKERRLKRLQFRANHRGIKEMDIILGKFAEARIAELDDQQLNDFEMLMNENDRDLLVWFTEEQPFPFDELRSMFEMIREFLATPND